jgi:hypothetical protein
VIELLIYDLNELIERVILGGFPFRIPVVGEALSSVGCRRFLAAMYR